MCSAVAASERCLGATVIFDIQLDLTYVERRVESGSKQRLALAVRYAKDGALAAFTKYT